MNFMFGLPSIDGKYDIQVTRTIINQFAYIMNEHHGIECNLVHNTLIHNARNIMAKNMLDNGSDYLFFIDSDMVLPNGALEMLVNHDKDIVSGLYFHKKAPYAPVMYEANEKGTYDCILDYPEKQLITVDGVGMGVCLIKRKVFEKLGSKCFDVLAESDKHPVLNGEDFAFCYRAKEAGLEIHVDTGIQAMHQTTRYIDENFFKKARLLLGEEIKGE